MILSKREYCECKIAVHRLRVHDHAAKLRSLEGKPFRATVRAEHSAKITYHKGRIQFWTGKLETIDDAEGSRPA